MQSRVHYLANPNQTQAIFSRILTKVITLYKCFVSAKVRHRRNVHLQKQSGVVIIASYLWEIQEECQILQELKFRTEEIVLNYFLMLESSHKELGMTLKYSHAFA